MKPPRSHESMPLPRRSGNPEQGFTILELLIGAGVATVGLYASLTLAMAALHGNTERRDSILAEQYAQHLLATIQAEGTIWTNDTPPANTGNLLVKATTPAVVGQTSGWVQAPGDVFATDKRVGPMGGNKTWDQGLLSELPNDRGTRFCAHYRLTWVTTDLIRAEVRIAWPHANLPTDKYADCPADMVFDVGNVGSITLPAMVMKNVYVQ